MRIRKKMVVSLIFALCLGCSSTEAKGTSSIGDIDFGALFYVPYYDNYARYVELGEYKVFYEEDFYEKQEEEASDFEITCKYLEKVVDGSRITGYPQQLTDSIDTIKEFFCSSLEIVKKYLPEEDQDSSNWNSLDAEQVEELFQNVKDLVVVSYAIAFREGIYIQPYNRKVSDSYSDMEEELEELLKLYGYEEMLPAYLEMMKDSYVVNEVEEYLERTVSFISRNEDEEIEGKNSNGKIEELYSEEDYIFPDSNSRYLTEEDVEDLSLEEIIYAKNEIFARLGRKFESQELQEYFNSKAWYCGIYEPTDFDEISKDLLNDYEWKNSEFLNEMEDTLN